MTDEDERVKAEKLAAAKKRVNSQLLNPQTLLTMRREKHGDNQSDIMANLTFSIQ